MALSLPYDLLETKQRIGHRIALLGNIPPLDVAVRQSPQVVYDYARNCLDRGAPGGGMILSVGGGISPGMPAASIDAMLAAVRDWIPPVSPPEMIPPLGVQQQKPRSPQARKPRPRRR